MEKSARGNTGRKLALSSLLLMAMQATVQAHHMEDGQMPQSFGDGFLSGLAHPVIGLDHLAFIVAIGLISLRWSRGLLMPLVILPAALLGTSVHLLGWNLPAAEVLVALSVSVFGLLLVLSRRMPLLGISALAVFSGIVHGYAFGGAILGAQQSAIGAYLVGFTVVQLTIALAVRQLALFLWKRTETQPAPAIRIAGMGIGAVGLVHLLLGIKA